MEFLCLELGVFLVIVTFLAWVLILSENDEAEKDRRLRNKDR